MARMAEEIGMSVSAFHHNFKAVTASSSLQYLKSVRLHKARMLILHDGLGLHLQQIELATRACLQFSRECKLFLAIVQWKSRSAFARVSARLCRKSLAEPTESTTTSSTPVWQAMAWYLETVRTVKLSRRSETRHEVMEQLDATQKGHEILRSHSAVRDHGATLRRVGR